MCPILGVTPAVKMSYENRKRRYSPPKIAIMTKELVETLSTLLARDIL
jgi:hypothetical protein